MIWRKKHCNIFLSAVNQQNANLMQMQQQQQQQNQHQAQQLHQQQQQVVNQQQLRMQQVRTCSYLVKFRLESDQQRGRSGDILPKFPQLSLQ